MDSIWVEKYRPLKLDDFVGNEYATKCLKGVVAAGHHLHLLLTGPPGIGKTSGLHCVARELLKEKYSTACLELNAADDRGIEVVREKIRNFAKELIELPPQKHKMVILDEVDSMTDAAQQALRRLMEVYSETTRFALACNQSEKVIDPIQSRCAIIRFSRITDDQMKITLRRICNLENVPFTEEGLSVVCGAAEGDMRKAIGALQAAGAAYEKVDVPTIYHACDTPPSDRLKTVYQFCTEGDWRSAHNELMSLMTDGYSASDLLKSLKSVVANAETEETRRIQGQKMITFTLMGPDKHRLSRLQLDRLLCRLCDLNYRVR